MTEAIGTAELWGDQQWIAFRGIAQKKMKEGYELALIHATDRVLTKAEQERNRAYANVKKRELDGLKRKLDQKEQLAKWRKRNGKAKFFFAAIEGGYAELKPETAARLFFIGSFLSYDGTLKIGKTPITKGDLGQILGVGRTASWGFWGEVGNKYIFEAENGTLIFPGSIFRKGRLSSDIRYQQIFADSVQQLYKMMPPRRVRYLGFAYQLLPFINTEYNILTHDIEETDLDKIVPLTVDEFCDAIGYDKENRGKLLRLYNGKLTFPVKGREERLVSFVTSGLDLDSARIFVNPHLLYHGHVPEEVKILGKFCEVGKRG